jgi:hypothetical protein
VYWQRTDHKILQRIHAPLMLDLVRHGP